MRRSAGLEDNLNCCFVSDFNIGCQDFNKDLRYLTTVLSAIERNLSKPAINSAARVGKIFTCSLSELEREFEGAPLKILLA